MAYVGNSPTQQSFTGGVDQYNGNNSNTAFGLTRTINTVYDVDVYVENVWQRPATGYTVSANTITFTSAPPAGSNNVVVVYRNFSATSIVPQQGSVITSSLGAITNINSGTNADLTFQANSATVATVSANGNFGLGVSGPTNALHVNSPVASTVARLSSNNTAAYVMLSDSGSASALAQGIGSNGNDVVVRANSAVKAIVSANGYVGVGTTTPANQLHVNGIIAGSNFGASANTSKQLQLQGYGDEAYINMTGTADLYWRMGPAYDIRMSLSNAGVLTLNTGQLKFPASQNASSDPNTLDDYEEGTWTPILKGSSTNPVYSTSVAEGRYVKIGKVVYVSFLMVVTGISSQGVGNIYMDALPFTASDTGYGPSLTVMYNDTWDVDFRAMYASGIAWVMRPIGVTQSNATWGGSSNLSTGYFSGSGCYLTS